MNRLTTDDDPAEYDIIPSADVHARSIVALCRATQHRDAATPRHIVELPLHCYCCRYDAERATTSRYIAITPNRPMSSTVEPMNDDA